MIQHAELIVSVSVPRPFDLKRTGGLTAVGVAQVHRDAAVLALELLHGVERRARREEGDCGIQPTPGMSNNGRPAPTSS